MRIGILFGGQSREREISFAGGRTVYDNLNKSLFTPVPIFVDSIGNFILLEWQYIYKGTIRDFYPPIDYLPSSEYPFQIYIESLGVLSEKEYDEIASKIGKRIFPDQFKDYFDVAFLALHGNYGEDGNIQGILEWYNIPYTGAGIFSSSFGIDKSLQAKLLHQLGFERPRFTSISRKKWLSSSLEEKISIFENICYDIGVPFVVKPAHQGSSVGVSIIKSKEDYADFAVAMDKALFVFEELAAFTWLMLPLSEKIRLIQEMTDIRHGIGFPIIASIKNKPEKKLIYHPQELLEWLENHFANSEESVRLEGLDDEQTVLFESFIDGKEFSCIVIQDENGNPIALPPTEIIKGNDVFDYRSKYLPGMARKITPIDLPTSYIHKIQDECCKLFKKLHFDVYARIDGFCTANGTVYLNDPNTTSGMLPSSFFFHQAAEIGLNPSQFLTYIIQTSLRQRIQNGKNSFITQKLFNHLENAIQSVRAQEHNKIRVAVIMGGYSSERHISMESGRNVYEKLASSSKYLPIPIFLTGSDGAHQLYQIPINIMLKDNADDIKEKIEYALTHSAHEIVQEVIASAQNITSQYAASAIFKPIPLTYELLAQLVDVVFIALHGRPGEDGQVQRELERVGLPYNGSNAESSAITIDKYQTNEILKEHGIPVAKHLLVHKSDWKRDRVAFFRTIEAIFDYPFICKPVDDGCSSAVKKIKNRQELEAYTTLIFRDTHQLLSEPSLVLQLQPNEEFPMKRCFLVESLITSEGADRFLEITGGLLTHYQQGKRIYEMFEPSETLAIGEVLSLEEKFLAGEGQNITPARFSSNPEEQARISAKVRSDLEKVAILLNVEGYARIDAFVRIKGKNVETIIVEVNSLPGMTPATCIFHQAALNGYTPYEFIDKILEYAILRYARMQSLN
ncbi:MAG: D-alanine--D-alanine ligase [Cytophagales bacterium]|nr:D-alanine--D-alanine ligase [Cytophagales bacterium]